MSHSSAEPLMGNPPSQARSSPSTLLPVLTASLSGLLFGYDTGIISSTLLYLPTSFPLSTTAKSAIASVTALLALFASPLGTALADLYGRRLVIAATCVLFVLGAGLQAIASGVPGMVLGRAVVGIAIGAASAVVPLYLAEIARAEVRGRLVTVQSLFITGGQVVAYLVGWACGERWRVAVAVGAGPAVVQLCLLGWLVETPRFLVMKKKVEAARRVLEGLGVGDVQGTLERIGEEVREEGGEGGWRSRWDALVRRSPGNRRALIIACMLQGMQQLCGFNVLMYFSATIFAMVGFASPVTASLTVAGTNFLFTLFAFSLIDAIGRRRILLISIPFMVIGLSLCAVCFAYLPNTPSSGEDQTVTINLLLARAIAKPLRTLPAALLLSLVLYVAAYALGLGCVPWQQSELFPLRVRAAGSGIATATNWSANFVVGVTFLPMMDLLGSPTTFAIYAVICALAWVSVFMIYPETAGLELEDVGRLLADGWGVSAKEQGYARAPVQDTVEDDEDEST